MDISGKVALITGNSVGTELAQTFLKAGSNVAFIYRNKAREKNLVERFGEFGTSFLPIRADLSNHDDAKRSAALVRDKFGGISFLLNALGGWIGGKKLHEHTFSEIQNMFSIDVLPTFNIMAAVIPFMTEQKFGRIINFISMQVFGTGAGNSIYAASKSAVYALTKAASEEYKEFGISVYALAPSTIDTENNRRAMPRADASRWVKVQELVDAVLFLCTAGDSSSGTIIKFPGKL
jgi:NAD(P)-dependent dehydrogenase (short-subunit alcohol dehydrogenase family)